MNSKHFFLSIIFTANCFLTGLPLVAGEKNIPLQKLWPHPVHLGKIIDCSPAIGKDGTIYFTLSGPYNYADTAGGKLAAVSPAGETRWTFKTRSEILSSPAIGPDENIYFGCRDKFLYAMEPGGRMRWRAQTGGWIDASPAIAANGTVYAGSWDGKFYAFSPDGKTNWTFATRAPIESSAAIDETGVVYFGSHDKFFYALNPDGSLKWKFGTAGAILSSPAIGPDGTIYFTSVDGNLYALEPRGTEKWHLATGGHHRGSPTLNDKGTILLPVNNEFWAVSSEGKKKWFWGYPVMEGCGTACIGGSVYFLGMNNGVGAVYEFESETGTHISTMELFEDVTNCSISIIPDGTLYFGGNNLYAVKGTASLAKSGWPKFRGGLRQTGRVGDD